MPRFTDRDEKYMREALKLARRGLGQTSPNPMVGCVIVKDEKVIGRGYHKKAGGPHAEANALKSAKDEAKDATMYLNLEPCCHQGKTPPCTRAIIEAGIGEVVIAMYDPNPAVNKKGVRMLREAGVKVRAGLLEAEARRLNEAFVTYHTLKRPFIIAKWAITLDGRSTSDSGSSKWISNSSSRHYVHEIRSQVDAIMVGIGTVIKDNPKLNVRLMNFKGRQPHRVVVDGHLKIPSRCNCLDPENGGAAVIITTESMRSTKRARVLQDLGHQVLFSKGARGIVDLEDALKKLYEVGIQSLFVEGGRMIHTSLFEAALVDKVVCFVAPKIIGGGTFHNPIEGWGIQDMGRSLELEDIKIQTYSTDVCVEGYIRHWN